ncbi:UvrD-helicase domain-containing protein [Candidatus Clavichlamydia salmonicola]|uniref:UvrD-helicase domain-containing protein n=1 Tax=Candidatus Clavichlamydia salmonicola TaxID=469812 RepID=UPI0018911639|nr:UvrD-helicase domain-containing protein [Candidatus Clavichlamydia salmonicola]
MTTEFNALTTPIALTGKYFLEASAGTGKTFAIEQLLIRLLCDPSEPKIQSILIVTFTKAATAELKRRIKKSLLEIINQLSTNTPTNIEKKFPYLSTHLTQTEDVKRIYRQLNSALLDFDAAQIFTIHGFCSEMLLLHPELTGFFSSLRKKPNTVAETILLHIRNYFIQNHFLKILTLQSIQKLAKNFPKDLHVNLLEHLLSKSSISDNSKFIDPDLITAMNAILKGIKKNLGITDTKELFEDLALQASCFKGLADRQHNLYPATITSLQTFAQGLIQNDSSLLIDSILIKMIIANRKKSFDKISPSFVFPSLLADCEQSGLFDLLKQYSDKNRILHILGEDLRDYIRSHNPPGEISFPDDLLLLFQQNLKNSVFLHTIQNKYSAVFIDEFQDTDQVQWDIFSTLFLDKDYKGAFFLVGDPKQSIYRFRNADIYVYQKAKKCFPSQDVYSLQVNFRSDPRLLSGLNILFSKNKCFFNLPKTGEHFIYNPLKSGLPTPKNGHDAEKKNIHFFFHHDQQEMFKFIEQEILELNTLFHIPLQECAILVKDRYQAAQFAEFTSLPLNIKTPRSLVKSAAFSLLKDLLFSLRTPFNHSACLKILLSPLFACTFQDVLLNRIELSQLFLSYSKIFQQKGLLCLFQHILLRNGNNLISIPEGNLLYADMEQIIEILEDLSNNPNEYALLLERMELGGISEETFRARSSQEKDAVTVITVHSAKGLEYSAVFPIGLVPQKTTSMDQEEIIAEKLRQTYVALTRAKDRLYLPVPTDYSAYPESPITLLLNKILEGSSIEDFLKEHPHVFSYSKTSPCSFKKRDFIDLQNLELLPLESFPNFSDTFSKTSSFSSLYRHEDPLNSITSANLITPQNFPMGPEIGLIIHSIFEKMNFRAIVEAGSPHMLEPLIKPFLNHTSLEGWSLQIAEMLLKVFFTPLKGSADSFFLADINPSYIFRECEFLFEESESTGFFKGFIDLFFQHNGLFYIVDWKTNFIGPSYSDYSQHQLKQVTERYHYDKQAGLYKIASLKYLSLFDAADKWGGSFYLFVRGCDPEGNGVIFFP